MLREFLKAVEDRSIYSKYRDPQEFMWNEERNDASEVYSCGMFLFSFIAGKDYFEYINTPADEYFMMADTDSDSSVIDAVYLPEKYIFLADIIKKMTVYRRDARISMEKALDELTKFASDEIKTETSVQHENTNERSGDHTVEKTDIPENEEQAKYFSETRFPVLEKDFDYGIILNNKRSGRIEFRPLYDFNGNSASCDIPVTNLGLFRIAVSKRHRNFAHISNPSSIYGDNIIPVGIAEADGVTGEKVRISINNNSGEITVSVVQLDIGGNDTGKNITVKWGDMNAYR